MSKIIRFLVTHKSKDEGEARREYVLNILLLGCFGVGLVASSINTFFAVVEGETYDGTPPEIILAVTLIFLALYFFSHAGKSKVVAFIFLAASVLPVYFTSYKWGVHVPQALLLYGLSVVMAGILLGSKVSFLLMVVHGLFLITLSFAQGANIVSYDSSWKYDLPNIEDGISASAMLVLIVVVSWLSNREIEKALHRARGSEKALKKERDLLEVKVEERTKELKRVQLDKVLHLYRLADFGRMAAGLFHELANPLTTVSLNLEQLQSQTANKKQGQLVNIRQFLQRAVSGTKRMENFIRAVRKQIQKQEEKVIFSFNQEVTQVLEVLSHAAKSSRVKLHFIGNKTVRTYGNPLRFNQLVSNLVSNAIEAYEPVRRRKNRRVTIKLSSENGKVALVVQDLGCGIPRKNLRKIFDPFFTTKSPEKGTGIGLSICKNIAEKDFGGKIKVESQEGEGTTATVEIPIKRHKNTRT